MRHPVFCAIFILCALGAGNHSNVDGAILWSGGSGFQKLATINTTTSARTPFPLSPMVLPLNGLAYNSADGHLYATTSTPLVLGSGRGAPVGWYRINPQTQSFEILELKGAAASTIIDGLEYDSLRNVFWGSATGRNQLLQISAAGEVTVVGEFSRPSLISGLAFDPVTDTLYGVDDWDTHQTDPIGGGVSHLVSINRTTLELTNIGEPGLGLGLNDLDSLAFDPESRMLYSMNDGLYGPIETWGQLVRIDPATGAAEAVGPASRNSQHYQGFAFVVAEPKDSFRWSTMACITFAFCRTELVKRLRAKAPAAAHSSSRRTSSTSARRNGSTSVTSPTV